MMTKVSWHASGLFKRSSGLFKPSPGLFKRSTGLFKPSPGLFEPSPGLFKRSPGLFKRSPETLSTPITLLFLSFERREEKSMSQPHIPHQNLQKTF